ncbi:hypothetical protein HK102_008581, partial [Quaeritorhiza haematococci]
MATAFGEGRLLGLPLARGTKPELNWAHIIHSEIVNVTSTMRKNQRWAINTAPFPSSSNSSATKTYDYCADIAAQGRVGLDAVLEYTSVAGKVSGLAPQSENKLLQNFAQLKARLTLLHDLRDLDPVHLLDPFLEVIRSGDTTGPITGAALSSVETFIKYKVL